MQERSKDTIDKIELGKLEKKPLLERVKGAIFGTLGRPPGLYASAAEMPDLSQEKPPASS